MLKCVESVRLSETLKAIQQSLPELQLSFRDCSHPNHQYPKYCAVHCLPQWPWHKTGSTCVIHDLSQNETPSIYVWHHMTVLWHGSGRPTSVKSYIYPLLLIPYNTRSLMKHSILHIYCSKYPEKTTHILCQLFFLAGACIYPDSFSTGTHVH